MRFLILLTILLNASIAFAQSGNSFDGVRGTGTTVSVTDTAGSEDYGVAGQYIQCYNSGAEEAYLACTTDNASGTAATTGDTYCAASSYCPIACPQSWGQRYLRHIAASGESTTLICQPGYSK